ncbi:MAG: tail fiber domain-containing protein [Sphingobacteriales bacterium]|nr:tail fiber domain-containing protein [Sphingobacteriales bacterium]
MKKIFLLFVAVFTLPALLQAQGYGVYVNDVYQYSIYVDNDYDTGTSYGAYISNSKNNTSTNYGIYATASNTGTGSSYAAYFNGITRLDGGADVNAASGGNVVIGAFTSTNIGIDENEIQARNDSVASTLHLNWNGGNVQIGDGNVSIGQIAALRDLHIKQKISNVCIRTEHESTTDYWETGIGTSTKNYKFYYNATTKADIASTDGAYTQLSDRRLKTDIEPLGSVLDKIMLLQPTTYYYNDSKAIAQHKSVGFIAQEVEEVFPASVRDVDNGFKGVVYDHFAVYSIAAIQELNGKLESKERENGDLKKELNSVKDEMAELHVKNEDLKDEMVELRAMVQKMNAAMQNCCLSDKTETGSLINDGNSNNYSNAARLEQNAPNPFYAKTIIQHYVPEEANSAQLQITALDGKVMKSINLGKGFSTTTINGSELAAGTYIYALIIDGKNTAAKEMILTK